MPTRSSAGLTACSPEPIRSVVLQALQRSEGDVTTAELVERLGVERSRVAAALRWLVEVGYVTPATRGRFRAVPTGDAGELAAARHARDADVQDQILVVLHLDRHTVWSAALLADLLEVPVLDVAVAMARLLAAGRVRSFGSDGFQLA